MALNEPEEFGDDFPPAPEKKPRRLPVMMLGLAAGLILLVALLALSY